jgi:hypothetical protein
MTTAGHRRPTWRPFTQYLENLATRRAAAGGVLPDIFDDAFWEARRKTQKQEQLPWRPNNRRPERQPDNNKPTQGEEA